MAALLDKSGARTFVTKVCRPDELDQTLAAIQSVSPPKPTSMLAADGTRHSVLLDFYVDDKGEPRMPVVLNSPSPAYSLAAVAALSQWRFSTPTRGGQPVAVRARQEFIFTNGS